MLAVFMFSCDSILDENISKYIIVSYEYYHNWDHGYCHISTILKA